MTPARRLAAGAVLSLLLAASPAAGGGCHDLQDGWLVPPDLLTDATPGATRGADHGPWVATGIARLYGLPELPLRAAAAGWRARGWRVAAGWQRLGARLLCEDRLRLRLLVGGRGAVGLAGGWDALRLDGGPPHRSGALSLELRAPGPAGTRLSGSLPLTPAPPWYGLRGVRGWWSVARGGDEAAWCLALDRDAGGAPLVEAEGVFRVAPGADVGLRWEPSTGTLGLTTAWRWHGLLMRTSHLAHPALGVTHRWCLAAGPGEAWP